MRSLPCVGINMLLETKWMPESFVTHGTFPFAATHVGAHPFNVACKVAKRGEDFPTFATGITLWKKKKNEIDLYCATMNEPHGKGHSFIQTRQSRVGCYFVWTDLFQPGNKLIMKSYNLTVFFFNPTRKWFP